MRCRALGLVAGSDGRRTSWRVHQAGKHKRRNLESRSKKGTDVAQWEGGVRLQQSTLIWKIGKMRLGA